MTVPEFRDEAAAAFQARKELGPEYENAVLESFADRAAETIDKRVDARLAERGVGTSSPETTKPKSPETTKPRSTDDNHLPLAFFSVLFGIGGSIGLTAGADAGDAGPVMLLIMWAGIAAVNMAYAGRKRSP